MSITAMNWVWQLKLKPAAKFVLMALADASDDDGYCWPSIPTLARKTCLDDRSVQRILKTLRNDGLVQIQQRFRNDGSRTSNGYRLPLNTPGDKLSPPLQTKSQEVVTPASPSGGCNATLTTIEHTIESKQLQQGDDAGSCLIYPRQLSPEETVIAARQLKTLPKMLAQEILDELSGRLNANSVRGAPLSYLRSLIVRALSGNFIPEIGIRVALAREQAELAKTKNAVEVIKPRSEAEIRKRISELHSAIAQQPQISAEGK